MHRRRLAFETLESRHLLAAWAPQGPGPATLGQVENVRDEPAGAIRNEVVGALHTVLADPADADVLFAGGTNGGLWRTDNATSANPTWTPLIDDQSSLSIGAMAFDIADTTHQTLIVANGRYSSFAQVGGPLDGLLLTTDGGASFARISDPLLIGRNFSGVAKNGDLILAAANAFGGGVSAGLFRSTDNGATWEEVLPATGLTAGPALDLISDSTNLNSYYVSIEDEGIFRSDDGGATWANVSANDATLDGVVTNLANNNTELAIGNGGRIFAAVLLNGQAAYIGYSDDQGATWTAMDLPRTQEGNGDVEGLNPREKPGGQGAIHFSIVVDPTTDDIVYVGGDRQDSPFLNFIGANDFSGRLFRGDTTVAPTGGVPSPQWEHLTHRDDVAAIPGGGTANSSAPHADSREMTFDAAGNLIEVDDGGIYRRTNPRDNTGDWYSLIGDIQTTEMHDVAYDALSNVIISGNQDTGTTQQSAAGSLEWISVSTADGGDVAVSPDPNDASRSVRYSSFQNLGAFRRRVYETSGALVSETFIGLNGFLDADRQFVTPFEINAVNPNRLVIGGASRLYESFDQGDNVSILATLSINSFNGDPLAYGGYLAGAPNEDVLYVGSGGHVFIRTNGSGAPLISLGYAAAGGAQVRDIALAADDWMTAFVLDSDEVYMTADAGANWTNVSGNIASLGTEFHAVEYVTTPLGGVIVVGGSTGVFSASLADPGVWSVVGTDLPNVPVWDLDYDPGDDLLIAGTLGRGAWSFGEASIEILPKDFGDAPDSYATRNADNGPRHAVVGALLGTRRDGELDGLPSATADGDDADNSDDEDGLTFSLLAIENQASATFFVSGGTANTRIDAFIDFNRDGDFDSDERITPAAGLAVNNGANAFTFTVPSHAQSGPSVARVRISETGGLGPTGRAASGEVEDERVVIAGQDFGDAPSSYQTGRAANGARHAALGATLGAVRDAENDGAPSAGAAGDDASGADDEDGLVSITALEPGQAASVVVRVAGASGGARLDAFIDFNRDGDFNDAGERITPSMGQSASNGDNTLSFVVPANARLGNNFLRLRLSTAGGLGPFGRADDGEVEDHAILLERPIIVTGPDVGQPPIVKLFDASGLTQLAKFAAFEQGFLGGVRVATGDVNGDGAPDVIVGRGPGNIPEVRVIDGSTLQPLAGALGSFLAFDASLRGGVMVASGDVNGDGFDDVIVGPDNGFDREARSRLVRVFSGATGTLLSSFTPFQENVFRTGYRVAVADFTGDGLDDVIVGMGPGDIPTKVKSFDLANLSNPTPIVSFKPFAANYAGGVYVGAGDVDGDGAADYVLGQGGGKNRLKVLSGADFAVLADFRAFNALSGGVRVSVTEFNDQPPSKLLTGSGPGTDRVRIFRDSGATLREFGGGYARSGVFVAGMAAAGEPASPVISPDKLRRDRDEALVSTSAATNAQEFREIALAVELSANKPLRKAHEAAVREAFAQDWFWVGNDT